MPESNLGRARRLIAEVGKLMFARHLTDLAGGNISMRLGDNIMLTPSYAGSGKFWQLEAEDVLVLDLKGNLLEGKGNISREAPVHLKLLNAFYPAGQAVIHAHARNIMVFCAANKSIPPVLEYTQKFGEIRLAEYARGGVQNQQLAENIYNALSGQEKRIASGAAAVIVPWHGLFAIGKDIYSTLDAVERIEVNARCILLGSKLSGGAAGLEQSSRDLQERIRSFEGDGE